jgi:hypothetical protein
MNSKQEGSINWWIVATAGASALVVALVVLSIWLFNQYNDQKTNVDTKVNNAVIEAKKKQADQLEAKFTEREKEPNREFVGPEDYGLVTFNYPKTWSVYVERDASSGGTYSAYLNPIVVPPVSSAQQFAARVTIENKVYEQVVSSYDNVVKKGELTASSVSINGNNGTKLVGTFSKDIVGAAVIFKIRDKTLTIRTDANTFIKSGDFDRLINSIKINK